MSLISRNLPRVLRSLLLVASPLVAVPKEPADGDGTPPPVRLSENVVVSAVRADEDDPVTRTDFSHEEIRQNDHGQEFPFILRDVPGVTTYAESGSGTGYSYFQLRGIGQTRVNMTLDGVPLNDPEESAVYFANFGGFSSAIDSVQVLRGVGTSTFGAAAFAGSLNFASAAVSDTFGGEATLGLGSFGTGRGSVAIQTGRFGPGIALYGRVSLQETDGYRDRSGMKQRTFFAGGTWQDDATFVKFFAFSGLENSQLAYFAVEPDVLRRDPRFNPMPDGSTDRFGQDFAQVTMTRLLGGATATAQLYYSGAWGALKLWDDPVARNELISYGIEGYSAGGVLSIAGRSAGVDWTFGAQGSHFARDHFADEAAARLYENTGYKDEVSSFLKGSRAFGSATLSADLQVRSARFRYASAGTGNSIRWTFFNPKIGARLSLSPGVSLFASVGTTGREPTRNDLFAGNDDPQGPVDLTAVRPERAWDVEAGLDLKGKVVDLSAGLYLIEFRDEIALTGELSAFGYPIRRNVPRSFRRGVELDARWRPAPSLHLRLGANLSWNRVSEWTQYYDLYDASGSWVGQTTRTYGDVRPLLTPDVVVSFSGHWQATRDIPVSLYGRWVAASYLDNANAAGLETPSYLDLSASAALDLARWVPAGHPLLKLTVDNLLDREGIWPSGYSYLFATTDGGRETLGGTPYYYPRAGRSATLTLDVRF